MKTRATLVLLLLLSVSGCGAPDAAGPALRLVDPDLMLSELTGPLHLRVFPKGAWRCDTAAGQVRDAAGARVLDALPGGAVTPAVRCGAGWSAESARYGTASPVDTCFLPTQPVTVTIPAAGSYLVLVHGQGTVRAPDGTTRQGILGAGCAEVGVAAGQQQSATVVVHAQAPVGHCGDGTLDFDESCDLGTANADGTACSARCQTPVQTANTDTAGLMRHPSVVWPMGHRLVVAWGVANVPVEDVRARYFANDGTPETNFGALAHEVSLGGGPNTQSAPSLTSLPAGAAGAFAAAWETLQATPGNVAAQVVDDNPPTGAGSLVAPGVRRAAPSVASTATRTLLAWTEPGAGVRASVFATARPLGTAGTAQSIADGDAADAHAVALSDGSFVVVYASGGDVWARRFGASAPSGAAFRVNPTTAGTQDQPAAAALPDGGFVVAWRDDAHDAVDGDGTAVRWVRVDASGTPGTTALTANTTAAGDQSHPALAVATGAPATVLVVWEDGPSGTVRGRLRLATDGDVFARLGATSADFALGDATAGQHAPAVTFGGPAGDRFAVAWEAPDGSIAVRHFPR